MRNLSALLVSEPHIVKVLLGEQWRAITINSELFDNPDLVQTSTDLLYSFLRSNYYVDDFSNHSERREWRATLMDKYGVQASADYMRTNSLRFNQWAQLVAPR